MAYFEDFLNEMRNEIYIQEEKEILTAEDLENFSDKLQELGFQYKGMLRLSFQGFTEAKISLGSRFKKYFSTDIFLKLSALNVYGCITVDEFEDFVLEKNKSRSYGKGLFFFMADSNGYISKKSLLQWLHCAIPGFPTIASQSSEIKDIYCYMIVEKIFFYLDLSGLRKIKVQNLLASKFINYFASLQSESTDDQNPLGLNWIDLVCDKFDDLDNDGDQRIGKTDFENYDDGDLSLTFIEHLFENIDSENGEINIHTFHKIFLTLEEVDTYSSVRFIFHVLDIKNKCYLNYEDLEYFLKEMFEKTKKKAAREGIIIELEDKGEIKEKVTMEGIISELRDMISPKNYGQITIPDILKSAYKAKFLKALISYKGFEDLIMDQRDVVELKE